MANETPIARGDRSFERLIRKLRVRDILDDAEAEILRLSVSEVRQHPPGRLIVRAGETLSECKLMLDGVVARYKDLADGQRQIMEMHISGDFMDLHSFLLKRLEHNIGSLTPVRLAIVPHDRVRYITENHPHLARLLWLSTLLDAAIHRERILSVGRRSALARIAHLLCEMNVRLEVVGLANQGRFELPVTQADLADATGLTSVHVNRMLRKLRDEDLVTYRGGEVTIHDWERLQRVAEFSPAFLYLDRRPR